MTNDETMTNVECPNEVSLGSRFVIRVWSFLRHSEVVILISEQIELRAILLGQILLVLRWQRQIKAKPLREPLTCFRGKSFKVIPYECPNIAHLGEVAFNLERPTFQSGFTFPKQFFIAVQVLPICAVLRCVIAQ